MNTATALRLLKNSGFHGLRADTQFIYMEDPSCILRSFETFLEYVWIAITIMAGFLLMGWAISLVRGAKAGNIFITLKNLLVVFLVLSFVRPAVNLIYGDNLFARGCKTISISVEEMNRLLDLRKEKLSAYNEFNIYESMEIQDSGATGSVSETVATVSVSEPGATSVVSDMSTASATEESAVPPQTETDGAGQTVDATTLPRSATESGRDVLYSMPDGSRIKRTGGTRAWRNNNPGNIRYSEFSRRVGAIGKAGGFAVFPDEATGMYAIEALLRTDSYNKLTISGAVSRYAPPSENNTTAYYRRLSQLTGLSINKRMSELTSEELTRVANAIRVIEGWRAGKEQRI